LDLNQLKQLLDLVKEHDLAEFEVEHDGLRLRVRKNDHDSHTVTLQAPPVPASAPAHVARTAPELPQAPMPGPPAVPGPTDGEMEIELAVVKSPIVGTFYRAPEPGAAAFVDVGSTVKKGDVLCIIEAMKLMNEIDSEYDGEIANIYVENGQPVQYGERLFAIRTR
jgi:acetyl-CoA carboxylase biotin carboxyl carrier protein